MILQGREDELALTIHIRYVTAERERRYAGGRARRALRAQKESQGCVCAKLRGSGLVLLGLLCVGVLQLPPPPPS